jgi:hypothetical protein
MWLVSVFLQCAVQAGLVRAAAASGSVPATRTPQISLRGAWLQHVSAVGVCTSVCCVQAGLVRAAAASGSVSAKARRKRKQQQQQADGGAAAGAGAAAAVAWANRRLQQREYQAAWLAFLRTDLPSDIYKKVSSCVLLCVQGCGQVCCLGGWGITCG